MREQRNEKIIRYITNCVGSKDLERVKVYEGLTITYYLSPKLIRSDFRVFVESALAEQKQKEFYQLLGFGQVSASGNDASNPDPASPGESHICLTRNF